MPATDVKVTQADIACGIESFCGSGVTRAEYTILTTDEQQAGNLGTSNSRGSRRVAASSRDVTVRCPLLPL